ncbi:RES domain-containing protein [Deinococcus sedimenti]|uniref:RES domain-containing protein n=1 Tax=Deinococcus sedimenti TaxID=1867090 RepID=UPI0016669A67|nr:RES domain-containing protein [Deinococcus sedimenti]
MTAPISGIGSQYVSGRFNVAGKSTHRVTYIAAHPHVSMREFRYTTASAQEGVADHPPQPVPPVALFSVTYNLRRVLDLTDQSVLKALGVKPSDLTGHWWQDNEEGEDADTQVLSQFVFESGRFDAIKYKSARINAKGVSTLDLTCFAVFPDALTAPSFIRVEPPAEAADVPADAIYRLPAPLPTNP